MLSVVLNMVPVLCAELLQKHAHALPVNASVWTDFLVTVYHLYFASG